VAHAKPPGGMQNALAQQESPMYDFNPIG